MITAYNRKSPFARLAFWQFILFFMLILFIWVSEILDLPAMLWNAAPSPDDYVSAYVLTLGIVVVAIVTVGHTYLLQKRIMKGILTLCTQCRKVRVNENEWEWIENYVVRHSLASVSHGLCPSCMAGEMAVAVARSNKLDAEAAARRGKGSK